MRGNVPDIAGLDIAVEPGLIDGPGGSLLPKTPSPHALARSLPAGSAHPACLAAGRAAWPWMPERSLRRLACLAAEVRAALDMGIDVEDPPPSRALEPRYTAEEEATLRLLYPSGGTAAAKAALPHRPEASLRRR